MLIEHRGAVVFPSSPTYMKQRLAVVISAVQGRIARRHGRHDISKRTSFHGFQDRAIIGDNIPARELPCEAP